MSATAAETFSHTCSLYAYSKCNTKFHIMFLAHVTASFHRMFECLPQRGNIPHISTLQKIKPLSYLLLQNLIVAHSNALLITTVDVFVGGCILIIPALMMMSPILTFVSVCGFSSAGRTVCSFPPSDCQESTWPTVSNPLHTLHPAYQCPVSTG